LPRFVTVCGEPLTAAVTTALKLFFASCRDQFALDKDAILN